MSQKNVEIVRSLVLIALGVFIAIFGINTVLDIYFAILFLVAGIAFGILAVVSMSKNNINYSNVLLSGVLIALSIGLFTKYLTFAMLINILIVVIIGFGAGLIAISIYEFAKKRTTTAILELITGVIFVTLGILYIYVADFRQAFWIVFGILVAVYGALYLALVLSNKTKSKK